MNAIFNCMHTVITFYGLTFYSIGDHRALPILISHSACGGIPFLMCSSTIFILYSDAGSHGGPADILQSKSQRISMLTWLVGYPS